MSVSKFMSKNVISLNQDQTVEEAAKIMIEKNIGGLPIVDSTGKLVGMITESDFIGQKVDVPHALVSLTRLLGQTHHKGSVEEIFEKAKSSKLSEVMSTNVDTISSSADLSEASSIMLAQNVSRLPVCDDGNLVGIITKRDILKSFSK
ncbi:CBS domain-containing protein [Halobacteriovorax sp. HLS]|uniref:CBS domain-containing protein n=1 Tax=Halobacteriovorax sp. HLS TaxID=2234000 RepID=UPI000FD8E2AA|nr:CBS domain-containing protein [Halobacteriovorax sp. HLS]